MQARELHETNGQRTFAVIFQTGDVAMAGLQRFAADHHLTAAAFTGIGAFRDVTVAYFDWQTKQYRKIPIDEQVEVLALTGDVSEGDGGKPKVHAHVVLGRSDGTTRGGHLIEGHVRPTLEVVVTESPAHLRRRHDPESGLSLISP